LTFVLKGDIIVLVYKWAFEIVPKQSNQREKSMNEFIETNSKLTTIQRKRGVMDLPPEQMKPTSLKEELFIVVGAVICLALLFVGFSVFLGW
jgi:hypothetical protein